ncbi:MAG: Transcriptional regulator, TraR/DksA family [Parcubacteria group bacterium GW2011_GWC2_42_6]|nr:MAG: Transcriptional regulator, TraR/DksA family [Parcubacteria group bacterium GW2011_GWA2_42_11]KKS65773.1 MAG: Transcriptional regulator, TraR/DksA family [Parcubacteria group bacterium GW2011_GWC2_42_6]
MNKKQLLPFQKKLEEKKEKIEKELASFAKKDGNLTGDYDAKFPNLDAQSSDENAQEVANYERNLSVEHALEIDLASINKALARIKKGTYGVCANCGQPIDIKRLEIMPEAELCIKCRK